MARDFDRLVDELYTLAPEEFVAARNAAADQARSDGDDGLAKRVRGLRRPTVAAWLVNVLAHQHAAEVKELLALGEQLRAAHEGLRGDRLRDLSTQRERQVAGLVEAARELAGDRATTQTTASVASTLQAALVDPGVAEQVRAGRLEKAAEYSGFGGPVDPDATPTRPTLRLVESRPERPTNRGERLAEARAALTEAKAARTRAAKAEETARRELDRLTEKLTKLREQERELAERRGEADRQHRRQARALQAAERGITLAERRIEKLKG